MYKKNVYLLDLCIFAYHLHAQTLIWPMDPYYEQLKKDEKEQNGKKVKKDHREKFMSEVREYFVNPRTKEVIPNPPSLPTHIYRGPGSLKPREWGWENNVMLDPIISDYRQLYPWRPGSTRPDSTNEHWIVYNTPKRITDRIEEVYMVRYSEKDGSHSTLYTPRPRATIIDGLTLPLYQQRPLTVRGQTNATDWLYCFEGGTGAIGTEGNDNKTHPVWSMMGFVLVERFLTGGNLDYYNLHIIFRGSRSGELRLLQSLIKEKGNPDWVTDTDSTGSSSSQIKDDVISSKGKVNRGFRTSMKTMLPPIMKILDKVQERTRSTISPRNIYVSGHSPGGGLATLFTSAVVLGKYQNTAGNTEMPASIRHWPWGNMKLIIFGAPTAGDSSFKEGFNQVMQNASRIYITVDAITKGTSHVGRNEGITTDLGFLDFDKAHSPDYIRRYLIQKIRLTNPLLDVPAPTGVQEQNEPWKTFGSVGAMLNHLEGRGYILQDCLARMAPQVVNYLTVLWYFYLKRSRETKNRSYLQVRNDLRDICDRISGNNFNINQELNQMLKFLKGQHTVSTNRQASIRDLLGDDMFNFIGICIVLAYLSKNNIAGGITSWRKNDQDVDYFLNQI